MHLRRYVHVRILSRFFLELAVRFASEISPTASQS
jgi:hypothetical protein